jgi:hypothetical protein
MGHGRHVDVAHGGGGDQIAVEQCRTGQRQVGVAADHARLGRLRERRRQRRHLMRFLASIPGQRAGECIEQQRLAVVPDLGREVVVAQRSRKSGQRLGCFCGHGDLPRDCAASRPVAASVVNS